MERVNSVLERPSGRLVKPPAGRLPLTGGDAEKVLARIRKSRGAASDHATPSNASIDLTSLATADLLEAFDALEKSQRTLTEFFAGVADFADRGVNPRIAFGERPDMRERFRALTFSAAHLYQSYAAASVLQGLTIERVLGVKLAALGEAIVMAIEVLDYAPGGKS